ncbi:helix-turn-helix transcriptional regulator [Pseudoxanthomonas mexicana]
MHASTASDMTTTAPPGSAGARPSRFLRMRDVKDLVGCSAPTIYRLIQRGEFPRQIVLGPKYVRWDERQVLAWMAKKAEAQL